MPVPTIDGELFSEAGHVFQEPSDKYPLGRWVAPEGASKPGIAAVGAAVYCEHPTTEILTVSYDLVDGRGIRRWRPGQTLPWDLMNHLSDPDAPIEAHNAFFELSWVEKIAGPQHGWVVPDRSKWRCSMATALVAQRPGALADLGNVLGLSEKKDKEGDRLIKKFCIPQQPIVGLIDKRTGAVKRPDQPARRIYPHDDPEDFERLCAYCDQDVRTEMAAMERLPPLSPMELAAWQSTLDQNARGMAIDHEGAAACINILNQVIERYGQECFDLTGFAVTQLEKLKGWLGAHGIYTDSLDAAHIEDLLARPDVTGIARRVLELRELTGSASVKKIYGMRNRMTADSRICDMVVHHGTRPGRPAGQDSQPLNLPKAGPKLSWCLCGKPLMPAPTCPWCGEIQPPAPKTAWQSNMVDPVLEIMSLGSLDLVERFYGDAMTAIQGCVRGLFTAGEGHTLVSTDYSSLQAVVVACLSGEQWKIEAFRNNEPLYLLAASKITGRPVAEYLEYAEKTGENHPDRQAGKTGELANQFQGWIGAWRAMEIQQGIDSGYDDARIKEIILAWRAANPMVVEMWGGQWRGLPWRRERAELFGLEGMFIAAVQNPGQYFDYRGIGFIYDGAADCLEMLLPPCDGHRRPLRYHEPRLTPSHRNPDELSISYMTWNTNPNYGSRGWVRMPTWGGRLTENAVMGVEVDIQRYGAKLMAAHGYPLVLSVYDENVSEIPIGKPLTLGLPPVDGLDPHVQEIEHLLSIMPPELEGWPIRAAGGWNGRRYRKG
jgi:DNA polymerase